jgi:hypothetical protein
LEAASHIAAGCTGAAFNILSESDVHFRENEIMIKRLYEARPFYDKMVSVLGRSDSEGIYTGWNKNSQMVIGLGGNWFRGGVDTGFAGHFFQLGVPAAYTPANAQVTVLSGNSVRAMADEEILSMLSKGVYMDAGALVTLNEMGYGKYTGFEVKEYIGVDCSEYMEENEFNEGFAGTRRDARQSFYSYNAASLKPSTEGARSVSRLIDYTWETLGDCAVGVFENELEGRICVSGYYPWTFLMSMTKSMQMKRILRWLSKEDLPAMIDSYHRINMWSRKTPQGKPAITLANSSLMDAEGIRLFIKTDETILNFFLEDCQVKTIESTGTDGYYKVFELPLLGAMKMAVVYFD